MAVVPAIDEHETDEEATRGAAKDLAGELRTLTGAAFRMLLRRDTDLDDISGIVRTAADVAVELDETLSASRP